MTKEKTIEQGAEAIIYLKNDNIIKKRVKKSYRIKELDEKLRKQRTRSEAKIIKKLEKILPVPKIIKTDEKEEIIMEFIDGKKLSDNLEDLDYKEISRLIGKNIGLLHSQNIIHGDLTTSNMIFKDNKVFLIDFGLAFHSSRIEDKAVDLHLLRQALEAKHFKVWEECFDIILKNYKTDKYEDIIKRIKIIESRGRYKDNTKINLIE